LELIGVGLCELCGVFDRGGLADDDEVGVWFKGIDQPLLHHGDGDVGDVDADPAATELLRGDNGGATAAEGIEHQIAGVGGCLDDALEQGFRFLSGVAEAFLGL